VFGVGNDWSRAVARTLGSNQTMVHEFLSSGGNTTFWVQRRDTPTQAPGTNVTINDTAPTNDRYNLSLVEIVPAPGPDTTAPQLSARTPAAGATGVAPTTTVTATFNEAMDASTVSQSTFFLRNGATAVGASVAYNSSTRVATLTPSAPLANLTTYTATVTSAVEDQAGNGLADDDSWSFTTVVGDVVPPAISGMSPASGATNVAANTTVTATFNEAMNASTISSSTMQLRTSGGSLVSAGVSYNGSTRVATLTPAAALASSATYTATVTTGVTDLAGNPLASNASWSFTTSGSTLSQTGQWSSVLSWPLVTLNATTLRTGEVLVWDGGTSVGDPPTHGGLSARLWNPTTQAFTPVPLPGTDLFCSGHCALPDGRIFVAGGGDPSNNNVGVPDVNIFDPITRSWTAARPMNQRRWYPTATCLPDGRVLVTSGTQYTDTDIVTVPEIYNPATNTWTRLTGASANIPYYPHEFVLTDGRILTSSTFGKAVSTTALNLSTLSRTTVDSRALDGGSAVMYLPNKVLKAGMAVSNSTSTSQSSSTTYVLDMDQQPAAWRQTSSMGFRRAYHTMTVLPDGNVLVTGGGRTKSSTYTAGAIYEAELWSPVTELWTTLARMQRPRLYHSIGILLPDARVLVAGGGRNFNSSLKELNAEVFSPPYLFKGPRPTIASAPGAAAYGTNLVVDTPDATDIASVAFMKPGSVTHGFDQDQRFVPATFQASGGSLTIQAPVNANVAPPGYYMLFIVNSAGVPSVASFVRLGP
jgi:hypothetical protein